jgi:hypothetical protein
MLFEVVRLLLEVPQRIDSPFLEAILASADETFGTIPVVLGESCKWRI